METVVVFPPCFISDAIMTTFLNIENAVVCLSSSGLFVCRHLCCLFYGVAASLKCDIGADQISLARCCFLPRTTVVFHGGLCRLWHSPPPLPLRVRYDSMWCLLNEIPRSSLVVLCSSTPVEMLTTRGRTLKSLSPEACGAVRSFFLFLSVFWIRGDALGCSLVLHSIRKAAICQGLFQSVREKLEFELLVCSQP